VTSTYTLKFHESAEKEWLGLDKGIRDRLLKVLERRLVELRILSAELNGDLEGLHKIKLQKLGHRQSINQQRGGWFRGVDHQDRFVAAGLCRLENPDDMLFLFDIAPDVHWYVGHEGRYDG
jgi:mRNA-degrading endonuclease RelE of RelBE toxin-antitoxin system